MGTPATIDALGQVAQQLLDGALAALDLTTASRPELAYLSYFQPSLDSQCDQAVVYCAGIAEEQTNPGSPAPVTGKRAVHGRVNLATLQLLVARCIATGKTSNSGVYSPPSPTQIGADAVTVMQDGWALWVNLAQQIRDGELFTACGDIHFDGIAPLAGEGGLAGWVGTFRVAVDGFTT